MWRLFMMVTLYLYRNGRIVTSLKTPKINYPAETKILSIGTKLEKRFGKFTQAGKVIGMVC